MTIPYALDGQARQFVPDFLVRVRGDDGADPLTLIVEVSRTGGHGRRDKQVDVATATSPCVPAVNTHGGFGHWAFVEVAGPEATEQTIRAALEGLVYPATGYV